MKKNINHCSFWTGMAIVAVSHVYLLFAGLALDQVVPHSIINLVGAGLFAYARFG